jgi:hypothetical protein
MISDAIIIQGDSIHSLIDACIKNFSAYSYLSQSNETQILYADKPSIRRDDVSTAVLMVFDFKDKDSSRCRVDMGVIGGDVNTWLNKIRDFITEYARENHMKTEKTDDNFVSSFVPKPTPSSYLKKCIKCKREIPIASEECEYCGARQPHK